MSTKRLFTGLPVLAAAVVVILSALGPLGWEIWVEYGPFWPVPAIGLGLVALRSAGTRLALGLSLLVVATGLIGGVFWLGWGYWLMADHPVEVGATREVTALSMDLDLACGRVEIRGGDTDSALEGVVRYFGAGPREDMDLIADAGGASRAAYTISQSHLGLDFGRTNRLWELRPNPELPVAIDLEAGFVSGDIDLRDLTVDRLRVEAGAMDLDIRLGDRAARTEVFIEAGGLTVDLYVPESVAVRLVGEVDRHNFDAAGLVREDGFWQTPGYEDAPAKAHLTVDAAISCLQLHVG